MHEPSNTPGAYTRHRWRRTALSLLLITSLFILLMPTQLSANSFSPNTIVSIYLLFLLLGITGLVGAVLFLLPAYPNLFRKPWGILLCLGLVQIVVLIMNRGLLEGDLCWPWNKLVILVTMWGVAAMLVLGIALLFYLVVNDHSVRLFLLASLLAVWLMVFYMRQLGPELLLSQSVTNQTGLVALPTVVCFSFWVLLLAPLTFLGHTFLLISRELQRDRKQMEDEHDSRMAREF